MELTKIDPEELGIVAAIKLLTEDKILDKKALKRFSKSVSYKLTHFTRGTIVINSCFGGCEITLKEFKSIVEKFRKEHQE